MLSKHQTQVELCRQTKVETESFLKIHLGIGISKGDRMDYAIQKSVELGVQRITPLLTDHCVVRLDPPKAENRVQHWQRIAQSACEQSGRSRVPDIDPPTDLIDWISNPSGLKLFLDPEKRGRLRASLHRHPPEFQFFQDPKVAFHRRNARFSCSMTFLASNLGPESFAARQRPWQSSRLPKHSGETGADLSNQSRKLVNWRGSFKFAALRWAMAS